MEQERSLQVQPVSEAVDKALPCPRIGAHLGCRRSGAPASAVARLLQRRTTFNLPIPSQTRTLFPTGLQALRYAVTVAPLDSPHRQHRFLHAVHTFTDLSCFPVVSRQSAGPYQLAVVHDSDTRSPSTLTMPPSNPRPAETIPNSSDQAL